MNNKKNKGNWPPERISPTIDEIVDNTVASMAIEGYQLKTDEIARVRARAHDQLSNRLRFLACPPPGGCVRLENP
jgi:hypothetical protein